MTLHRFSFPTTIHFGPGASALVADHLRSVGVKRPLLVTDQGVAPLPFAVAILGKLRGSGLAVDLFSGVRGNPTASQVSAGVAKYRIHEADGVVGLGGGAALDVAKAVALMAVHEGSILDYAWDDPNVRPIRHLLPHVVAIPTTSGTGSEVGRSAVISDDATHVKKIVFSPSLLARAVFADPELTFDLPAPVTAATGMDALTHNVESYLSPAYHPLCDGVALEGARIAARALRPAVHAGRNLAARSDMMMSSLMGGVAFQKDLGAVHSCAHALSTVLDLHHGLANGIMIDHVMRFNADAARAKLSELARVCEAGASPEEWIAWLERLKADIGIPARLGAVGVLPEHIGPLVDVAFNDTCHQTNPKPCTRVDFERIFSEAL